MSIMASTHTRAWPRWLFRVAITVETVFVIAQAALAGGFLAGHYDLLAMHKENATITGIAELVVTVTAVLLWKPGGGPWWPIAVSLGLFALEAVQIIMGYARVLAVHVPLGVLISAGIVMLLTWAWRAPTREVA
jgi:hypothetical protein